MTRIKFKLLFAFVACIICALNTGVKAIDTMITMAITSPQGCGAFTNGVTLLSCQTIFVATLPVISSTYITTTKRITATVTGTTRTVTRTLMLTKQTTTSVPSVAPVLTTVAAFCYESDHTDILTPCTKVFAAASAAPVMTTVTAFCFEPGHHDKLTPCTKTVAAASFPAVPVYPKSPKTNAAITLENPFKFVTNITEWLAELCDPKGNNVCFADNLLLAVGAHIVAAELLLTSIAWLFNANEEVFGNLVPATIFSIVIWIGYLYHLGGGCFR